MDNNQKQKCSLKEHKNSDSISYCKNCNIYMCNKCQIHHSEILKTHSTINLNNNFNDLFTGFCKQENHVNKLEYFCKSHNELVCLACISKIKNKFYGQHTDCEIYNLEEIQEEKKNKLDENIVFLEDLSKSLEKSINELKKLFENIN